nr:hypothetical protein [uncultured Roseateles sp.]
MTAERRCGGPSLRGIRRWLLVLCLGGWSCAWGQEAGTVRWMTQDIPPHFSYLHGKPPQRVADLANGELDGFLRLLITQMPQYRHEFVDAGFPRFESLVRQGQTLCSVLHLRTPERLNWLYFTQTHPPQFSRQIHLIVRRDKAAQFDAGGQPQQFAELLQRPELLGLLPRDRSFGPKIDALLKTPGLNTPQTVVATRSQQLLAMLRAGRMDYTLEYPSAVDEYLRSAEPGPELIKLPLAEGRSTLVATAACTRNAEGRKYIEAIDQAVRKLAQDPQREAWIRAWRGDALDEQDRLRINRYMDERAKGGALIE